MHCPVDTGLKSNVHKIDAKSRESEKGNVYHVATHCVWKKCKLTQDKNLFFKVFLMEGSISHRTLKKGKLIYFSLLLHTKYEQRIAEASVENSRTSTMELFCKKGPVLMLD